MNLPITYRLKQQQNTQNFKTVSKVIQRKIDKFSNSIYVIIISFRLTTVVMIKKGATNNVTISWNHVIKL